MGRGAFGYVFKVQYGMGTFVARKLIVKRPGEGRAQIRDRAFREYDFMKLARDDPRDSVGHVFAALPVPIVHCIDETPDDPAYNDLTGEYIIELEFAVEGTILQYIHLNEGLVNPAFLALIVRQFLRGLEWQHGKNILHAHLKSGNILVFPWPFSKVGDLASSIDLSTEKVRRCLTSYNNDSPEMIQVEIKGMGLQPEMLACLLTSFHLDAR